MMSLLKLVDIINVCFLMETETCLLFTAQGEAGYKDPSIPLEQQPDDPEVLDFKVHVDVP